MSTPITIEEFTEKFTVRVVEYQVEQNNTISVHFEVRCNVNGRLSIHLANVDPSGIQEDYTTNDVLSLAWESVKSAVSSWATTNVEKAPFSMYTPTTSTNDISVADLNDNFVIRISRWELYPKEKPTTWCIGFSIVKNVGNQTKTIECTIPVSAFCNNTLCLDIMNAAWDVLKNPLCQWAGEQLSPTNVINNIFVPTDLTI